MSKRDMESAARDPDGDGRDDVVSEQYRRASTESTPRHLDEAVLQQGRAAVAGDRWKMQFHPWLRPLALAATIALSLAVLLEINAPDDNPVVEDFSSATSEATDRIRELGEAASAARPPGDPVATEDEFRSACDPDETVSAERWWQCIVRLRDSGRSAEADVELERLSTRYPDFLPAQ